MAIYYSVTTKGLYPDSEGYSSLPEDAQEISQEAYAEFVTGKEGYAQVFDEQGPRLLPIVDAIEATKDITL